MFASLVLLSSPRWRTLPWSARRAAWEHHVRPLLLRWPVALAKTGLLALVVSAAWRLGAFDAGALVGFFGVLACSWLAGGLLDLALVARHRGRILSALPSVHQDATLLA